MTYQPIISSSTPQSTMPLAKVLQDSDKRKSIIIENDGHEISTNGTNLTGIASIVDAFNRSSGVGENGNRSSRSSSVSSIQPVVSNLIKIYSEATASKSQRTNNVVSTGKHDELIKVFEQATSQNRQRRISSPSNVKQQSQANQEVFEEITWDNLVHG